MVRRIALSQQQRTVIWATLIVRNAMELAIFAKTTLWDIRILAS
jgi:hypothetical protein